MIQSKELALITAVRKMHLLRDNSTSFSTGEFQIDLLMWYPELEEKRFLLLFSIRDVIRIFSRIPR